MKRVVLIHFKVEEAQERIDTLRRAGHTAEYVEVKDYRSLRIIRANPPDAVVIDLARLPSHGKEIGLALRGYAATRTVPLVYIEGDPRKTERIRAALPDAIFTTWDRAGKDIEEARAPIASLAQVKANAYSGTPLPTKLGIKAGSKVMAIGAPESFERILGPLPDGAEIVRSGRPDVLLVFTTSQAELEARFTKALLRADPKTRLWVAWPKKSSGVPSDLHENAVRDFGLAMGWVDYKVCAIDSTWSGLLFAPRKTSGG